MAADRSPEVNESSSMKREPLICRDFILFSIEFLFNEHIACVSDEKTKTKIAIILWTDWSRVATL